MRLTLLLSLTLVLLMQIFSKTIIYAKFVAEQEYIAKVLCENRFAPDKNCCGKCHLQKQMDKDQQQTPFSSHVKSFDELVLISEGGEVLERFAPAGTVMVLAPSYSFVSSSFSGGVFRPPCVG